MQTTLTTKILARALSLLATGFVVAGATLLAPVPAKALECGGIEVPDGLALILLNSKIAGERLRLNKRKTLVINRVDSISGTNCNVEARVALTLERKLLPDAHGSIALRGKITVSDGQMCLVDTRITDFNLTYFSKLIVMLALRPMEFDMCL